MPDDPLAARIDALIARLSLEQKTRLVTGASTWTTHAEPAIGLRAMIMSDGPVGLRNTTGSEEDRAATTPCPTALAASWDPGLAREIGRLLAAEARRKGADILLAPTINLHRTPLGGRHFECFSEDPYLTAQIGGGYVDGLQRHGVAATIKHFVANDSETDRFSYEAVIAEQPLRELYLRPFEDIIAGRRPWLVMAAYNAVNGPTMTENDLLASPLKSEWGFDGLVVSDWTAVRTTAAAARAATDLAMPGPQTPWSDGRLTAAVKAGEVPEEAVDDKVRRLLRLAARVGALDGVSDAPAGSGPGGTGGTVGPAPGTGIEPVPGPGSSPSPSPGSGQAALLRRAAAAGMVLARNNGILPLDPGGLRRVALIGPNAARIQILGGGSARTSPPYTVTPQQGLAAALGGRAEIVPASGVPASGVPASGVPASGVPASGVPAPGVPAPGVPVGDGQGEAAAEASREAPGGTPAGPDRAADAEIARAAEVAASCEVAIVIVGTSDAVESEGFDRTSLALPGRQDYLVRAVLRRNPRTVVVVNTGAPVELPWLDEAAATLLAWFPGQEAGNALADVLTGAREPGGRMPTTWPRRAADCPVLSPVPDDGKLRYTEGLHAGYRGWLRGDARPALPFGSGLGYTSWRFTGLSVLGPGTGTGPDSHPPDSHPPDSDRPAGDGPAVTARVTLANTGARAGTQTVQVYLSRPESAVERPARWLGGFARVSARPGETVTVDVPVPLRQFAHWSAADRGWRYEPGRFEILAGDSVASTPLSAAWELTAGRRPG